MVSMLYGAVAGDIIGSRFEHHSYQSTNFQLFTRDCRFTDDTVLTAAVASAILTGRSYGAEILRFGRAYPDAGYGGKFKLWLAAEKPQPYRSFGNGSSMRASPVGWAFDSIDEVLAEAQRSAEPTHNHPEGVKGAQAVALAIFLARRGGTKLEIRREIETRIGYQLNRSTDEIRPNYSFDVTCQGSVPEALICFLEASSVEDAVRLAVSLGGDADTQASIAGAVAEAFYGGVPSAWQERIRTYLTPDLNQVFDAFHDKFNLPA